MVEEFTADEIRRLLDLLDEELARRGVAGCAYVLGGAAIALAHDSERRTVDIDAVLVPREEVLKAAQSVASAENLPSSWLNDNASWWTPTGSTTARPRPHEVGLSVEVATPQTLLAMKLVASRNRDLPDIKLLAEALGVTEPVVMADLVRDQYGDDQLELVHGGYADMLLWCETLARRFWPT